MSWIERMHGYFAALGAGKIALWCYLIWYLCMISFYFDPSPEIWLNAVGISAVVGTGLRLSVSVCADRWQTVRLFLIPFCVSTFSALTKGHGFVLVLPPKLSQLVIFVLACTAFVVVVMMARRRCPDGRGAG